MKKIYTINGKQYQVSDKEQVINGGYYLIKKGYYLANDTVCQFKDGMFFYETEDGTKWFNPREILYNTHNTEVFYLEEIQNSYTVGIAEQHEIDIKNACDAYCKVCGHFAHTTPIEICRHDCHYYDDFVRIIKGIKRK